MLSNAVCRLLMLGWLAGFAITVNATITVYDFEDDQKREQFDQLIDELRCPKCQNQNIADSDAGVAKLIKDRVYKLTQEGKTKSEITDHMIERYGDFVTYRPPLKPTTFLLWFGPIMVFLIALIALVVFVRGNQRKKAAALSQDERDRVQSLLKKYNPDDDDSASSS